MNPAPVAESTVLAAYRADGRRAVMDGAPRVIPARFSRAGLDDVEAWYEGWDSCEALAPGPALRLVPGADPVDAIAVVERALGDGRRPPDLLAVEVVAALVAAGLLPEPKIF